MADSAAMACVLGVSYTAAPESLLAVTSNSMPACAQMSKALYPVTSPLSHKPLDAGCIYFSNLQVKGSGLSPQPLDPPLPPAKLTPES